MSTAQPDMRWYPYTTRARHLAYGDGALPGLRVIPAGTPCLAARLHDCRVVLTFDDLSIVLGEDWYIEGVEDPRMIPSRWTRDIYAIEDAKVMEAIEAAIEAAIVALQEEKKVGPT
jgi:hypothetical protein